MFQFIHVCDRGEPAKRIHSQSRRTPCTQEVYRGGCFLLYFATSPRQHSTAIGRQIGRPIRADCTHVSGWELKGSPTAITRRGIGKIEFFRNTNHNINLKKMDGLLSKKEP